eukprot:TRINITY_DN7793_c0_g1_i1.p1 TRINITY_DN7793_c0_g1~~TRINITY_DN7793_c0_g1_i1.p1  ORF type:complete len:745 (-),score=113.63 TRINITY_DN7793_c0_g1_i1:543-2777(-)
MQVVSRAEETFRQKLAQNRRLNKNLSEEQLKTVKRRINSACYSVLGLSQVDVLFARWDKTKEGWLDLSEFRNSIRKTVKISPSSMSDDAITSLFELLDEDKDGRLSIEELCRFLGQDVPDASSRPPLVKRRDSPFEIAFPTSYHHQQCVRPLPRDELLRVTARLRGSSYRGAGGRDLRDIFAHYAVDGTGTLDILEFKRAVRRSLKISPIEVSNEDLASLYNMIDQDLEGRAHVDSVYSFLTGLDSSSPIADTFESQHDNSLYCMAKPLLKQGTNSETKKIALADLQAALKSNADPNTWEGPNTPLWAAVERKDYEMTNMLLAAQADPAYEDSSGVGILHLASYGGEPTLCQMLVAAASDPNSVDEVGQTPLFFAPSRSVCVALCSGKADILAVNRLGQTTLHVAAKAGLSEVVEWMISKCDHAAIAHKDAEDNTALDYGHQANLKPATMKQLERALDEGVCRENNQIAIHNKRRRQVATIEQFATIRAKISVAAFSSRRLQSALSRFDEDGTGSLTEDQLRKSIRRKLHISENYISEHEISLIFNFMETESLGSGIVSIEHMLEFLGFEAGPTPVAHARNRKQAALPQDQMEDIYLKLKSSCHAGSDHIRLHILLGRFSTTQHGELVEEEFRRAMRRTFKVTPQECSDRQLWGLFERMDKDEEGSVSIDLICKFLLDSTENGKRKWSWTDSQKKISILREKLKKTTYRDTTCSQLHALFSRFDKQVIKDFHRRCVRPGSPSAF